MGGFRKTSVVVCTAVNDVVQRHDYIGADQILVVNAVFRTQNEGGAIRRMLENDTVL